MRTYYTDYVRHCIRFFLACPKKEVFEKDSDRKDWTAASNAFKRLSDFDKKLIINLYSRCDDFTNNLNSVSKSKNIDSRTSWMIVNRFEKSVAKFRGLI